ncbi:MAG: bifunctional alpha,alpha-trehalose-phosphate synthase (UDP-forming)/trehalose-phosphatase [bacterium]|nr:bifunctional alpha,alpha-trehalose-phosphate synthase (UDP-forming)/trehalose-phosphatase [bacterium]
MKNKLILVSNRLPVQFDPKTKKFRKSDGGLVQALSGVKLDGAAVWMGSVAGDEDPKRYGKGLHPVPIEEELYEKYYSGLANDVLWPLFHYELDYVRFDWDIWDAYCAVNRLFAEEIARVAAAGDSVWIHDYHFFMLPHYLRELRDDLKIGFFLHIPFPSSEVYRTLPVREKILSSLIECDLVGFHDYSYLRHFVQSIHQVLGLDSDMLKLERISRTTEFGVFPVSIDTPKFTKGATKPAVQQRMRDLKKHGDYEILILGVDRLDYIKGIDLKLRIFHDALERFPELRNRVALLQIAVPSRTEVPEYIKTRNEIEQLVGMINGKFSTATYTPVKYLFNSVNFEELLALYRHAQVLFVSSKRDGMNLVALEYIAAQDQRNPGVVVLSEFAGAASNLSHVTLVNPWNISESADRLAAVLALSAGERRERHAPVLKYLNKYDATNWAVSFIKRLSAHSVEVLPTTVLNSETTAKARKSTRGLPEEVRASFAGKRVFLLDYDGTLAPIEDKPELAVLNRATREKLRAWQKREDVELIVVSGRDPQFLLSQFDGMQISMAAEHGARFYDHRRGTWTTLARDGAKKREWTDPARQIMKDYSFRVPGSFIERKNFGVAWHFRNSPSNFAEYQSRRLVEDLEWSLLRMPVSILRGKKVVEVRMLEASKGAFVNWYRTVHDLGKKRDYTLIALGDDRTDEEMFEAIRSDGITIKVGMEATHAAYRLREQAEVLPFLERLIENGSA